jgi:hypothetical protein
MLALLYCNNLHDVLTSHAPSKITLQHNELKILYDPGFVSSGFENWTATQCVHEEVVLVESVRDAIKAKSMLDVKKQSVGVGHT